MLRSIHEKDIPKVLAIELVTQPMPWSDEAFVRCFQAGYHGWVVEVDQDVMGFIILSSQAGESHILNLCVHPNHQHQGHGRSLMVHALTEAKRMGAGMIFLEVRRSNEHAIALYDQLGFVQIGERTDYYPLPKGREDALVFAKDLGVQ